MAVGSTCEHGLLQCPRRTNVNTSPRSHQHKAWYRKKYEHLLVAQSEVPFTRQYFTLTSILTKFNSHRFYHLSGLPSGFSGLLHGTVSKSLLCTRVSHARLLIYMHANINGYRQCNAPTYFNVDALISSGHLRSPDLHFAELLR